MKKNLLIVFLLLVLVGGGIAYYLYNKPAPTAVKGEAEYLVNAEDLLKEFEQNEALANEKYLNKVIAVTGLITDISEAGADGVTLTLSNQNSMFGVSCQIADPAEAAGLEPGQQVTIKGLCTGYLMDVVLVHCVVQKPLTYLTIYPHL